MINLYNSNIDTNNENKIKIMKNSYGVTFGQIAHRYRLIKSKHKPQYTNIEYLIKIVNRFQADHKVFVSFNLNEYTHIEFGLDVLPLIQIVTLDSETTLYFILFNYDI